MQLIQLIYQIYKQQYYINFNFAQMLKAFRLYFRHSSKKPQAALKFKIPYQSERVVEQQKKDNQQSSKPVKIIKINRKSTADMNLGVKPIAPEFQPNQYLSKTETKYQQNIESKIQDNLATSNFYDYEISRGEDLIDNIPVDPYYQYKITDLRKELQYRKNIINRMQRIRQFVDPSRFQKLKNLVSSYQSMRHRYQLEQFVKKIKQYPGSIKGPNPHDDPQVFSRYINSIMPQWVRHELILQNQKMQLKEDLKLQTERMQQNMNFCSSNISDNLHTDPRRISINDDNADQNIVSGLDEKDINIVQKSDVQTMPYTAFDEFHQYNKKIRLWDKFRAKYDQYNREKKTKQCQQILDQACEAYQKLCQKKPRKSQVWSLYGYYRTIPKQIREHPGVRTTFIGLQFSQPDIGYEQKVQMLNYACLNALPLDKFSMAAMQKLLVKKKTNLTPHLVDRIFNMHPQFTWDIYQFLTEVKDQKLRSISTVKEKQQNFIEPPQLYKFQETDLASLPVDYWDNDDGFWDQYIDQKYQRYEQAQPISKKPKKYFQH